MHHNIGAIVYGHNKEAAADKARQVFDGLCDGRHAPYDYWRPLEPTFILPLASDAGRRELLHRYRWTYREWRNAMQVARAAVNLYTDADLWRARIPESVKTLFALRAPEGNRDLPRALTWLNSPMMLRHYIGQVGAHKSSYIYLYDDDGEGCRRPDHVRNAVNQWPDLDAKQRERFAGLRVFIALADAHS